MRGPGLNTIHSALRSTAFEFYNDHDEDLARDCLLGAEVLGIQDPIGMCGGSAGCSDLLPSIRTLGAASPVLAPRSCISARALGDRSPGSAQTEWSTGVLMSDRRCRRGRGMV